MTKEQIILHATLLDLAGFLRRMGYKYAALRRVEEAQRLRKWGFMPYWADSKGA